MLAWLLAIEIGATARPSHARGSRSRGTWPSQDDWQSRANQTTLWSSSGRDLGEGTSTRGATLLGVERGWSARETEREPSA